MSTISTPKKTSISADLDSGYGSDGPITSIPLTSLEPTKTAICLTPTPAYMAYLTTQQNYIFITMRLAAVCVALTRFSNDEAAKAIGQFAVNLLGAGMFRIGLEHYFNSSKIGDDLVSVKWCLGDVIEDLEGYFDIGVGGELREVVKGCGLGFVEGEVPEVVEMGDF